MQYRLFEPITKHVLASLGATPGAISPEFFVWVRTVTPHLYSGCHPDPLRFGGDITEKPFHEPLEAYN